MIDWYIYRILYLQIGCFCSIFMVNYIVGKYIYIPVTWSYGLLQVTNPTFLMAQCWRLQKDGLFF